MNLQAAQAGIGGGVGGHQQAVEQAVHGETYQKPITGTAPGPATGHHAGEAAVGQFGKAPLQRGRRRPNATTAPISPPTRACDDEEGMPNTRWRGSRQWRQSGRKQDGEREQGRDVIRSDELLMASATAVPPSSGRGSRQDADDDHRLAGVMAAPRR